MELILACLLIYSLLQCSWPARKQTLMSERINQQASQDEFHLLELLRNGNEDAFVSLIERYHTPMLRLAMIYVSERAVAEEVVQEAWMGVLEGLNRFEGRAALKTWIFRILTNCAKTRALHE